MKNVVTMFTKILDPRFPIWVESHIVIIVTSTIKFSYETQIKQYPL